MRDPGKTGKEGLMFPFRSFCDMIPTDISDDFSEDEKKKWNGKG